VEFAGLFGLWLLFAGIKGEELAAAAIFALISTVAFERAKRALPLCFDPPARAFVPLLRAPWLIVHDTFVVAAQLIRPRRSRFRSTAFHATGPDCRSAAKRALAATITTLPPNSVVVGFDYEAQETLYHELRREPPPDSIRAIETA
jgi:multisubunit Na+/H+ antiporter MnhE subunit